jgi:hypothetical protein
MARTPHKPVLLPRTPEPYRQSLRKRREDMAAGFDKRKFLKRFLKDIDKLPLSEGVKDQLRRLKEQHD